MRNPLAQSLLLCCAIFFLGAGLYLPWLGRVQLRHEEPRRALIARTMIETGDYLVPRFAGQLYSAKPPLQNWLIVLATFATGRLDERSARLPSLVCLIVLASFCVLATTHILGFAGRSFLATAILLAPELMSKARLAEIELPFTLLVTTSLWSWFLCNRHEQERARAWVVAGLLAGLAFLAKREPGLLFVGLGIVAYLLLQGRPRMLVSRHAFWGLVAALAPACLWIVPMLLEPGPGHLWHDLQAEVLSRGLPASPLNFAAHLVLYPIEVLAAIAPFSLLLLPLACAPVRSLLRQRYGAAYLFALAAVLANFPLYWLRGAVAVRYFLPMLPTALLLAAMVFEQWLAGNLPASMPMYALTERAAAFLAIGVAAAALALGCSPLFFLWPSAPPPLAPWWLVVAVGLALLQVARRLRDLAGSRPRLALLPVLGTAMITIRLFQLAVGIPLTLQRLAHRENAPALVAALQARLPVGHRRIAVLGPIPAAIWFYAPPYLLVPEPTLPAREPGELLLFDAAELDIQANKTLQELARFSFKNTQLLLARVEATKQPAEEFRDAL